MSFIPPPSHVQLVTDSYDGDKIINNSRQDSIWKKWLSGIYERFGGNQWYDLTAPIISAGRRGVTSDFDWVNYNGSGIYQPRFSINEDGIVNFHINHDIKRGSKMYPHVHWELNYIYAARDDDSPIAFSSVQTKTLIGTPSGVAHTHHVTETSDADAIDAFEVDTIICMQLKRISNGATDNTNDIFGHFVDFHYQRERFGTISKSPDFYRK